MNKIIIPGFTCVFRILWYHWKTILGSFIIYTGLSFKKYGKHLPMIVFSISAMLPTNAFLYESEMYGFGFFL